jgi:hypothetical protein
MRVGDDRVPIIGCLGESLKEMRGEAYHQQTFREIRVIVYETFLVKHQFADFHQPDARGTGPDRSKAFDTHGTYSV